MRPSDQRLARLIAVTLAASWLAGTGLVMAGAVLAPLDAAHLAKLGGAWGWYAAGYGLFLVSDGAIALLGVILCAWLRPASVLAAGAIVVLFALAGAFGMLADLQMLAAAQAFRDGSALLTPEAAPGFLAHVTGMANWLSAASFFPPGLAALLVLAPAREAGVGRGWLEFTAFLAAYQIAVGTVSVAAFLSQNPFALDLALLGAVVGLPVLSLPWLGWMLREMKRRPFPHMIG